ncbi:IclR family transcriptional regulator [Salipiger mangrovisoli]|uniref:IclR family transcriptional regulator n=1 Tax=Salipiger mangrovisoli TaxID=2865933 RepID=A0ABR9X557_9RHOB|nr:IclR family transcriptional regulator [Salipiger mangrovisoli]MBE9638678.1 IclR family transcriptional regulator [Salipiger mangrovisoli]
MVHIMEHPRTESSAGSLGGSQSVDRALALLGMVGRRPSEGASLGELVAESGLNKPTVRRLMLALIRNGMVEQNEATRRYFLGEESYILGTFAAHRHGLLELSFETLARLAQTTGDAAFLSVRRGFSALCLHREEGTYPIRTYALMTGRLHPLGVGAGSLAMLSALPDAEVDAALAANAARLAQDYPMLQPEEIRTRVAQTREQGYALNPGLVIPDSWGLGIALRRPDGALAGALSLAAIESRMQQPRREELVMQLRAAAQEIEHTLAQLYAARTRI